jgi:SAM-dependent MidA family methyltransferase
MSQAAPLEEVIRNLLTYGDLSFRDFMETALYYPGQGYYARGSNPIRRGGDYVTAPILSPVFSFGIGRLIRETLSRCEGGVLSFVDIGCGDGSLVRALAAEMAGTGVRFWGVDRSLSRAGEGAGVQFVQSLLEVDPDGTHVLFSNELHDALPFTRLVQRGEHLHELWVTERDGALDWIEHEAAPVYEDYFAARDLELRDGQFADVSLEWEAFHRELLRFGSRILAVTVDYGFHERQLFDPRIRRFGTAAAYSGHRVHRDLLTSPGEQDLTAHVNFSDLLRAGAEESAATLYDGRLAKFLLALGVTEHPLFRPVEEVANLGEGLVLREAREDARRLVLPDGIGEEMRVLVQTRGLPSEGWSFQRALF